MTFKLSIRYELSVKVLKGIAYSLCKNINLETLPLLAYSIFSVQKRISNLKKSTRNTLPAEIIVIGNNDILIA